MNRRHFVRAVAAAAAAAPRIRLHAQASAPAVKTVRTSVLEIEVPSLLVHGRDDAFGRPAAEITAAERRSFPKLIDKRIIEGSGHFTPHETPVPVAAAILDAIAAST